MLHIVAIPGSLRRGSFNRLLAEAAAELAPDGCQISVAPLDGIPLYDGDLEEREGVPASVEALKAELKRAHGLLMATPEYNQSLPGVFKNAMDWLTRPPADVPAVFRDLPVGLMGATPGVSGTRVVQAAWLPVLRALGTRIFSHEGLWVSGAHKLCEDGRLTDERTRERIRRFLESFVSFASNPVRKLDAA